MPKRVKEAGQEPIAYVWIERVMASSRMVNVETEMGEVSVYFNSGKTGADRSAWMMVKKEGISVGF